MVAPIVTATWRMVAIQLLLPHLLVIVRMCANIQIQVRTDSLILALESTLHQDINRAIR